MLVHDRLNPDWVFHAINFLELELVTIYATELIAMTLLIHDLSLSFNYTTRTIFRNRRNVFKGAIIKMKQCFYIISTMKRIKCKYFCDSVNLRFLRMSYSTNFSVRKQACLTNLSILFGWLASLTYFSLDLSLDRKRGSRIEIAKAALLYKNSEE